MPDIRVKLTDLQAPATAPATVRVPMSELRVPLEALTAPTEAAEPEGRTILGTAQDLGLSLLKGAIAVPEAAVGLADLVTGGRVGKWLERGGDKLGFQPGLAKQILDTLYSDPQKRANLEVQMANGVVDKAVAALSNPSVILQAVAESAPLMVGGAGVGRGVAGALVKLAPKAAKVAPLVGAATGEGSASAGSSAESVRQATPGGRLTPQQSGVIAASGAGTGLLGAFGGKLATWLKIADVDTLLVAGATSGAARRGLVTAVVAGAVEEGFLEELPQSVQEQVAQNIAQGKPWAEGVDDAAVMGSLAGAVMGGGAQVGERALPARAPVAAPPATPAPAPTAQPVAAAPTAPVVAPPVVPAAAPALPIAPAAPAPAAPQPQPAAAAPPVTSPVTPPVAAPAAPPATVKVPIAEITPVEPAAPPAAAEAAPEATSAPAAAAQTPTTVSPAEAPSAQPAPTEATGGQAVVEGLKADREREARAKSPDAQAQAAANARASIEAQLKANEERIAGETPAASTPERDALIERIVTASRKPEPEIVPVIESLYSDGKWHGAFGVPHGVTDTGQTRTAGYVYRGADGTTFGQRHETEAAARAAWQQREDGKAEDFRQALRERDEAGLQSAAEYWLKEQAPKPKPESAAPATPTTPAAAPAGKGPDVTYNAERQSIEVRFPSRPEPWMLERLKREGFKWAKTARIWYHKKPETFARGVSWTESQIRDAGVARVRELLGAPAAQAQAPAAEQKPAPAQPTTPEHDWQEVGENADGQTLYEDARGVRSVVENGVRRSEPVRVVPTRAGVQTTVDTSRRRPEWTVAKVTDAARANGIEKAEARPKEEGDQPLEPIDPSLLAEMRRHSNADLQSAIERMLRARAVNATEWQRTRRDIDAAEAVLKERGVHPVAERVEAPPASAEPSASPAVAALETAAKALTDAAAALSGQPANLTEAPSAPTVSPEVSHEQPPRPADSPALAGAPTADGEGAPGERPTPEGGQRRRTARDRRRDSGHPEGAEPGPGEGTGPAGMVPAERGRRARSGRAVPHLDRPTKTGRDYRITDADAIGAGSESERISHNIDAIRTLKRIEAEHRLATPEEQQVLVRYVGWGGLPHVFTYHARAGELQDLLTDEEYRAARGSTVNAHYTSSAVVSGMYDALKRMGFQGGRVLEPASGIGNFFGLMPSEMAAQSRLAGVELDSLTGRIAQQLYQSAHLQVKGFESATLPDGYFDLAISNVPFGKYAVHDPAFKGRPRVLTSAIHNYFFAKALDKVRPGGLVAFITSRFTMDAQDSSVRRYLAEHADLLGAIRLPRTAFKQNAGTEVVTDILFLRKRGASPGEEASSVAWMETPTLAVGDTEVPVNQYFHDHPEMVLGTFSTEGTMYRGNELTVEPKDGDLGEQLAAAAKSLPKRAYQTEAAPASTEPTVDELVPAPEHVKESAFVFQGSSLFVKDRGRLKPVKLPTVTVSRIRGALEVRDALRQTMRAMLDPDSADAQIATLQQELNRAYDRFVKKFGYLSTRANIAALDEDPDKPLLLSLESWREETKTATKASIFSQRTLTPKRPVEHAESGKDALLASMNELGRVDFAHMARLTGTSETDLQAELAGLVYRNPSGGWESADEYLSGNVRDKLAQAEAAAALDPAFAENVKALRDVQPADLTPADIDVRLGASWVPPDDVQAFAAHILDAKEWQARALTVRYVPPLAAWTVTESAGLTHSVAATSTWGTQRANGVDLLRHALNLSQPTVYDTVRTPDGKETRVVNQDATLAAREKLQAIKDEFKKWLWADDARATRLVRLYNTEFNNLRLRAYDGEHLTFPGMAAGESLRAHQKAAVWRAIQSGNTLLAHVVGAGKTFEMVATAMEARRLGLAKKPVVTVPNHLVEQWGAEWLRLYPAANILVATKRDFEAGNRKKLMARIATGDWDGVIVAHSSFGKLPISDEAFNQFIQGQLDELEDYIQESKREEGKRGPTVKQLERAKKNLEAKLKNRRDVAKQDTTLTFEELGVDMLMVDEADLFKNLWFPTKMTRVAGLPQTESSLAFDMFLKVQHVQRVTNGRGILFATGTPISNTMAEMYTMQRYLQLPLLERLGLQHFDAWAQQFGETVQSLELAPEGTGYRARTRFARFSNLPELLSLFRTVADVKTIEDLPDVKKLLPKIAGGKPGVIACPAGEELKAYVQRLAERAERIRKGKVDPSVDNMLKVTSDGRKAALDLRLLGPGWPAPADGKVQRAADTIFGIWQQTAEVRGAQLVFSDMGAPDTSRFSVYAELKAQLVSRGVPTEQVAFIHDANTDAQKEALFDKVRSGRVRVLIGSTEKMGAGTNVQNRLVALHHLDAPWRPRDIEQREGRIVRQGNELAQADPAFAVHIYRYVTEGSFDAYMWQTLETKARFIAQAMSGNVTQRSAEDVEGGALTYAEVKALASGNPLVLEKVKADTAVRKYSVLKASHDDQQWRLRQEHAGLPGRVAQQRDRLAALQRLVKARTLPETFALEVGGTAFGEMKPAGEAFQAAKFEKTIGHYAGFALRKVVPESGSSGNEIRVEYSAGEDHFSYSLGLDPVGSMRSLTHGAASYLDSLVVRADEHLSELTQREIQIAGEMGKPFEHADRLAVALADQARLEKELDLDAKGQADEGATVSDEGGTQPEEGETPDDADRQTGGGGAAAGIGTFDETLMPDRAEGLDLKARRAPAPAQGARGTATVQPIEFPELVDLARTLQSTPQVVKRFRNPGKVGEFSERYGIRLAADLFKKGHERQLAAALAHEIGHLVDWLPDRTLKRGNILGRIRSLRSFLKHTFTAADGTTIKLAEVRAELAALSAKWRPWDPATASAGFNAYRKSSKELYADALSVLLNNPGLLEQEAPTFYRQFFSELDKKPEVKAEYFALQEVLAGTPEELVARRRGHVREMFDEGNSRAADLERQRIAEREAAERHLMLRLRLQLRNKHAWLVDQVKALRKRGVRVNPEENPVYALNARNYLGGKVEAFVEQHFQPVLEATRAAGISWTDFGEALFYERIIAGDRSELANPRGLAPAQARQLYDDLQAQFDEGQLRVLHRQMHAFRQGVKEAAEAAHDAGLYTDELYAQMQANPAYVTFQVLDHLEDGVTSRVYRQTGTLKDIANPADATILKTIVTIRATEHQRVKRVAFAFLDQHFPEEAPAAKTVWTGKGHRPIEPKDRKAQRLVTYFDQGKLTGRYVAPYIADSLENESVGQNNAVLAGLRLLNGKVFRPLFITFNVGFQSYNLIRDFLRYWKNMPGMTIGRALQQYAQATRSAKVRGFGLPANPTQADRDALAFIQEAKAAQILSVTYNDMLESHEVADEQIETILAKVGIEGYRKPPLRHPLLRPLHAVLDVIRHTGDLIETLPKAAAIIEYKGQGAIAEIPSDLRDRIRRLVGSPDFLGGGTLKPVTNNLFLFSHAITEGIMSDVEVATAPETRAAWWWKTAKVAVVPKLLMFAAMSGLLGEALRRMMESASEYDRTNYLIVPVGEDEAGNVHMLRLPLDDTDRTISGLLWKALRAATGDKDVLKTLGNLLDYTGGQLPSVSPVIEGATSTFEFLTGRNPYDAFRNRNVLTDDEFTRGGWPALKKFLGWEFQQLGGSTIWKFTVGERPREQTLGQRILALPVLSNVAGRFYKVTKSGRSRVLAEAAEPVARAEAGRRIDEREAVNDAIHGYQREGGHGSQSPFAAAKRLAVQVAGELYDDPQERHDRMPFILKRLQMGITRGQADPTTEAVLGATSVAQRVAVLEAARDRMDRDEFSTWLRQARRLRVVSDDLMAAYLRAARARAANGAAVGR